MNKISNILFGATVLLLAGGCVQKTEEPLKSVDLRYRADDSYMLDATDAKPFSIVVTSTEDWEVFSEHPDWCIIDEEEGKASDPELVHVGKGEKTTVHVQYYDNPDLDDRTDKLTIKSDFWIGKTITVIQKGIAFLSIPEEEKEFDIVKAGGEIDIHVNSNQNWTARLMDGSWLVLDEGESGNGNGIIKLTAQNNPGEKRYGSLKIFDRHDEEMVTVNFTQDGVQLDPASFEIRAGYDQLSASLDVVSNTNWIVVKDNDADTWYSFDKASFEGNGTVNLTLTENTGTGLRVGNIILRSVNPDPEGYVAEKIITVKQAHKVKPVRYIIDNDVISSWKSDWINTPVYTKNVGTLFTSQARLNKSGMPFGTYTFRWSAIDPACRVRLWLCFDDSQEIKYNIAAADGKMKMDFNCGMSTKPTLPSSSYPVDITQPVEMTVKMDPSGAEHCHVTFLVNGEVAGEFDSSDAVMNMVKWGVDINMYFGVDTGGSAVCEWYEYTAPVNWDE